MKTMNLILAAALLGWGAGCTHTAGSGGQGTPSDAGRRPARDTRSLAVAQVIPPLYRAEMDAKERMLLRIKLAELQDGNATPRFGRGPVERAAPGRELSELQREYAWMTLIQSAPAGKPGVTAETAIAQAAPAPPPAPAGSAAIPTPTGKKSGSPPPPAADTVTAPVPEPTTGDALTVRDRRDTEAHTASAQPLTPANSAAIPTPTGRKSGTQRPPADETVTAPIPEPTPGDALTPKPDQSTVSPPSRDKGKALAELLRLYLADKITPQEYHARRAEILAEP